MMSTAARWPMTGVKEGAARNHERKAATMAIESLVVLGLGTLFLLVLGLYATTSREGQG